MIKEFLAFLSVAIVIKKEKLWNLKEIKKR